MDTWLRTSLLLCLYGFFKELRPSEPFLTNYLIGPQHNLTESEVYYEIYPVWTYSFFANLIVVFLITDLLRYKPVIVFEGISYVVTWCLLLWARGVGAMQFMEFMYGIATSTEVAYYTYIYAKVAPKFFQRVTSYTRAALLAGRFMAGVLAQVLTTTKLMDYHTLNYISLANVSVSLFIACLLPPVPFSIYFHRQQYIVPTSEEERSTHLTQDENKQRWTENMKKVPGLLWEDFKLAYSNKYLVKWSVWWAFATCGNYQVGNFIQTLWQELAPMDENTHLYNGLVEATQTLLSALSAFAIGYLHLNWEVFGEGTLAVISLVDGLLLITMGLTTYISIGYINYILFRVSYQVLITIASYQVAKGLRADSYGLVFGINMTISLLLQSLLTLVVVQILEITPSHQFVIYGLFFLLLALAFFLLSAYTCGRLGCDGLKEAGIWDERPTGSRHEPPVGTTEAA